MMGMNDTSARYVGTATGSVRDIFLPPVRNGVEFQGRASKFDRTRERKSPVSFVVALTAWSKAQLPEPHDDFLVSRVVAVVRRVRYGPQRNVLSDLVSRCQPARPQHHTGTTWLLSRRRHQLYFSHLTGLLNAGGDRLRRNVALVLIIHPPASLLTSWRQQTPVPLNGIRAFVRASVTGYLQRRKPHASCTPGTSTAQQQLLEVVFIAPTRNTITLSPRRSNKTGVCADDDRSNLTKIAMLHPLRGIIDRNIHPQLTPTRRAMATITPGPNTCSVFPRLTSQQSRWPLRVSILSLHVLPPDNPTDVGSDRVGEREPVSNGAVTLSAIQPYSGFHMRHHRHQRTAHPSPRFSCDADSA